MGPTASGKTTVAIEIAQHFPCDIISVDSGMIYRHMDIGTAKPTREQLAIAPHKLIDILDPKETYSAAQFRLDAQSAIEESFRAGCIPLLVGGTMLYFKILQQGISPLPSADARVRAQITAEIREYGVKEMHRKLQKIDPQAAGRIKTNDSQRIQRALEIFAITGERMSDLLRANPPESAPYKFINLAIAPKERSALDAKIWQRLQLMLQQGFIDEVDNLRRRGDLTIDLPSMRAVGYRQVWQYLQGEFSYDEMQQKIAIATRHLAKRQMTWLRSWPSEVNYFDSESK